MPRKAKGKELTQEQFVEIKAKYECNINVQDIANEYGITREYLTRYAKKEGWIKGDKKVKALYDATKLVHEKKILTQFKKEEEKQADIVISKLAKKEGEKVALLTLKSESFKREIEAEYAKGILLSIKNHNTVQELIQSGQVTDTEFEYVGHITDKNTGKVLPGKILKKTRTLLPKDLGYDQIKVGQAFGFAQFPQQQNNTQINIGGEVVEKESERQLEKVKNRADFQDFVGKLQK
jgi:hypothetical protein